MRRAISAAMVCVLAAATACSGEAATQNATVAMTIGGKKFTLEVAADAASRQTGLMNRESMPADRGMIFVFAEAGRHGFWMDNTKIPLDLLYVDASGKIVDVATLKAMDRTTYTPEAPALYVIELNAGTAAKLGVKKGDSLTVPAGLPAAK